MLFVIAADLLQTLTNDLLQQGLISRPLPTHDPDFPVVQYADDTLLFLNADKSIGGTEISVIFFLRGNWSSD